MLADIAERDFARTIYRIDAYDSPRQALVADGYSAQEIIEMIRFAQLAPDKQSDLVFRIFEPRDQEPPYTPGRFGKGQHPVLYCALEPDTSAAEKLHHLAKDDWFQKGYVHAFSVIDIDAAGKAKDLRDSAFPQADLISDNLTVCHQIGAQAVAAGLALLISHSARAQDGTTTPVLKRDCIQAVAIRGSVVMAAGMPTPGYQMAG